MQPITKTKSRTFRNIEKLQVKTMKIGQDINMRTNIEEGYAILEFKKRDLYIKGQFNPDGVARFIKHYPDYIKDEMVQYGGSKTRIPLMVNTTISANEVFEEYMQHADSINRYCGLSRRNVPSNEYELMSLADDVDMYCGLA